MEIHRGIKFCPDPRKEVVGYLWVYHVPDSALGRIRLRPQPKKNRTIDFDANGRAVGVEFYVSDEMTEAKIRGEAPDLPDVDLRGLSKVEGFPPEGEMTLILNEHGIVPLVSYDLIPE